MELVAVYNLVCPSDVQRYIATPGWAEGMENAANNFRELEMGSGPTRSSDGELAEAEEEWLRMREEERTEQEGDFKDKWEAPV